MGGVAKTVAKAGKSVVKVAKTVVKVVSKVLGPQSFIEAGKVLNKVPGVSTILGVINPVAGAVATASEVAATLLSKPKEPAPPPQVQVPQPAPPPVSPPTNAPQPPKKEGILGISFLDNLVEGVETIFHKAEDFGKHIAKSWLLGDLRDLFA